MSVPKPCCAMLPNSSRSDSPFDQVIALGYCDGPSEGFLHCGGCGREFHFRLLDRLEESPGEDETRIFGLSGLPGGTIASFSTAMEPFGRPEGPFWVPKWSFPSEEIRQQMDGMVDRLYSLAGPIELVFASSDWLTGEIIASRSISSGEMIDGRDWFSDLELDKAGVRS